MFRGAHPDLDRTLDNALRTARELGHPRTGSEHLLLALSHLTGHHDDLLDAVHRAAPLGAGAAQDRAALAAIGVDYSPFASLVDRPPAKEPLFPLGSAAARDRCARMRLGLDVQAAYAASLRLALARRERDHRPEHLALTLVAMDPGVAWLLEDAGVDRRELLDHLAQRFPPPRRNVLLRAERRIGHRARQRNLVRRYNHTTGRMADAPPGALITGWRSCRRITAR